MLFAGQPGCIFFKLPGMKQKFTRFRPPTPDEQELLTHLVVRLVPTDRVKECDRLITEHHYLKSAQLVGEHLRYVAEYRGQWMALSTWSAAALHIRARDSFIGWIEEQRRTRLPLVVNNSRLLVLPLCRCPNLISRFMKLMLARVSQDWEQSWGHPVALAETFVDPHLYQGTAYKASGWNRLGQTAGWKRSAEDFYQKHDRPKQIWVRELVPNACRKLCAERLLPRIDATALERALLLWQEQLLGPSQDKLVIVDGKTLRHAHVELVSAVDGSGRWLGTVPVQEGSNEIPAARRMLGKVSLANKTALADALHTQLETAQQILFEGGGDYALTVKDNQKELVRTLATLLKPGKFSPSAHDADSRADSRTQSQSARDSGSGMPGSDPRAGELPGGTTHCATQTASAAQGQEDHRDSLFD